MKRVLGVIVVLSLSVAATAAADDQQESWPVASEQEVEREGPVIPIEVPERCKVYVPTEQDADPVVWNQALSFAACVQDATVLEVRSPDDVRPMFIALTRALAPSVALYLSIIDYGPEPVQLRAAYQIGMMYVGLVVRARRSITAQPSDPAFHPMHAQLEAMLVHPIHTARLVFVMIDRVVRAKPSIDSDPVTREMVRSARAMLLMLDGQDTETMIGATTTAADLQPR